MLHLHFVTKIKNPSFLSKSSCWSVISLIDWQQSAARLTCRTPAAWSEPWTPRPAARRHPSAAGTSSAAGTLPARPVWIIFILKANIKPETWFRLVAADSPTRPAQPWQLCLSSGGSLHPGPRRATTVNPTRGSAHNTHQYSLI